VYSKSDRSSRKSWGSSSSVRVDDIFCRAMRLPSCLPIIVILLSTSAYGSPENQPIPLENQRAEKRTALLSFRERECFLTEGHPTYAFVAFALQVDGEIQYFHTETDCSDFQSGADSGNSTIFGEQVTIFGDKEPAAIRRENGKTYRLTTGRPIDSFFSPNLNEEGSSTNLRFYVENPHPALATAECRLLRIPLERDRCLRYQADFELDLSLCEEISEPRREDCKRDVKDVKDMLASRGPIFRSPNGRCEAFYQEVRRGSKPFLTSAQVVVHCQENGYGHAVLTTEGKNFPVTIHWIGDDDLKISYRASRNVGLQPRTSYNGVAISFENLDADEQLDRE